MRRMRRLLSQKDGGGDTFDSEIVRFQIYDSFPVAQKVPTDNNRTDETTHNPAVDHEVLTRNVEWQLDQSNGDNIISID